VNSPFSGPAPVHISMKKASGDENVFWDVLNFPEGESSPLPLTIFSCMFSDVIL
jgi:hypothetical protein